jgi:hypothetical protein
MSIEVKPAPNNIDAVENVGGCEWKPWWAKNMPGGTRMNSSLFFNAWFSILSLVFFLEGFLSSLGDWSTSVDCQIAIEEFCLKTY